MPTEVELAAGHGVSRVTARRALEELSRSGLVERRRRVGTRVTFRQPTPPLEANVHRAVESLKAFGRTTAVRVIDVDEGPAPADIAAALAIPTGTLVVHAERLRSLDGEPLGLVSSWMPTDVARHVPLAGLATTPMLALLEDAGLTIGSARQTIAAAVADAALAERLAIPVRSPVLLVERIVRDDERPILFTRARYRGDRYRITLDLGQAGEPLLTD